MKTIIAEFCQNHKGDIQLLKEMVWAAAEAGASYAKIQSMLADDLTSFSSSLTVVLSSSTMSNSVSVTVLELKSSDIAPFLSS